MMVEALCGIDIDADRVYIALAKYSRQRIVFLQEADFETVFISKNFFQFLQENTPGINQIICEKEKQLAIGVTKIYLNLPLGVEQKGQFSVTIPLNKRKKITAGDIILAKKYLQDTALEWDDFCVHNFVLSYEAEGKTYPYPPIGIVAKKIKLTSYLIWVKDKFYKDTEALFSNLERNFAGFVSPLASMSAAIFTHLKDLKESYAVIDIAYDKTCVLIFKDRQILRVTESDFGLKKIFNDLEKKIVIAPQLAKELFNRYISFGESARFKEVSIKTGTDYINLSAAAANTFVKEYLKNEFTKIFEDIKDILTPQSSLYICGRLNAKEGFCDFLKTFMSHNIKLAGYEGVVSKSFGALNYGTSRFLEEGFFKKDSFLSRAVGIYKEYF